MQSKIIDFASSFGVMLVGVALLFLSSVTVSFRREFPWVSFPRAGARAVSESQADPGVLPFGRPLVPLSKDRVGYSGSLTAASAIVVDANSKTVFYRKESGKAWPLASITKLMTALALQDLPIRWTSSTAILDSDYNGSDHHLKVGESFTLEDLWNIGLIGSSNTAITALIRESGLTEEKFVARMNDKARELGLQWTYFVDPTGLSEKNVSNASDAANLLKTAFRSPRIYVTMQKKDYMIRPLNGRGARRMWSTNRLLTKWIPTSLDIRKIAGKTGYTLDAGYNFAANAFDRKGRAVIVVVLGATSTEARFVEARDLSAWAFDHFVWPDEADYASVAARFGGV